MILVGGLGTRLRSLLGPTPKIVAEVGGRPFITYLLDQVEAAGVREVVLCTGYRADEVKATLGPEYKSLRLVYSEESQPMGTAGAIRLALPLLKTPTVMVLNGDSYCRADMVEFRRWHDTHQGHISLALVHVDDTSRFGRVIADPEGHVMWFMEKKEEGGPGWINAGIYFLSLETIAAIPEGRTVSLERETFPRSIGQGLFAWSGGKSFLDIGTPDSFALAEEFLRQEGAL